MKQGKFIGIFIKIGKEEHIKALQTKGEIFCQNIHEFTKGTDESYRTDRFENVVEIHNVTDYILSLWSVNKPEQPYSNIRITKGTFNTKRSDAYGNVFCMYSANVLEYSENEEFFMDKEMAKFGTHYCIILNVPEFVSRLHKALESSKLDYAHHRVEYLDFQQKAGKLQKTIFQKDIFFEYQKEWRLFIPNSKIENIKLNLGDLSDITKIGPVSANGMRFKWERR